MRSEEEDGGAVVRFGLPAAVSWFVSPPTTAPPEWAAPLVQRTERLRTKGV
jgi:hypothetical protein